MGSLFVVSMMSRSGSVGIVGAVFRSDTAFSMSSRSGIVGIVGALEDEHIAFLTRNLLSGLVESEHKELTSNILSSKDTLKSCSSANKLLLKEVLMSCSSKNKLSEEETSKTSSLNHSMGPAKAARSITKKIDAQYRRRKVMILTKGATLFFEALRFFGNRLTLYRSCPANSDGQCYDKSSHDGTSMNAKLETVCLIADRNGWRVFVLVQA